jgi:hypothetical protein
MGGGQRGLVEALDQQPALVGQRPDVPAPPGPPVAQQELRQPMPGASPVLDHVGAGAAQVAPGLLGRGGDADGDQFPGPVQPRQSPAVPPVGLDLVAGGLGISDGAITSQRTPMLSSSRASSKPVGPAS